MYPASPTRDPAVIYRANGILSVRCLKHAGEQLAAIAELQTRPQVELIETGIVEKPGWRSPNAMALQTGNAAFDSKRVCVTEGNCLSDTMIGLFIRPRLETRCNGMEFAPGALQAFDLKPFDHVPEAQALPEFIRSDAKFDSLTCIAYLIFHHESGKRILHGGLVTDRQRQLIRRFDRSAFGLRASLKSDAVLRKARFYLTDECFSDRQTVWTRH
jgi:hypothetical protein